jgi:hypothetical protein
MSVSNSDARPVVEPKADAPEQAAQATAPAPETSPYDDLLCTICNLKACWMTPEAAGKTGST